MAASKTEKQREKEYRKAWAECPRTVGQLQTVQQTHNGNYQEETEQKKSI